MKFNLAFERLKNQKLGFPLDSPLDIVRHLGAVQSQDYNMALWGIGSRMKTPDLQKIESDFNSGLIVRTHILRPTWHFVPGEDLKWMIQFSAPYITKLNAYQLKQAGLDSKILSRTRQIIEKSLRDRPYLTREELVSVLHSNKINTEGLRPIHILFDAECAGLICSGPKFNRHQTYALVDKRIPVSITKNTEEALSALTQRYFQSHGPASVQDFAKWASLPLSKAKQGLDMWNKELVSQDGNGQNLYFFPNEDVRVTSNSLFLLPSYDEYLLGYADRSFALEEKFKSAAMTNNGIFNPIVVYGGKVIASWKRVIHPKLSTIEFNWLYPPAPTVLQKLKKPLKTYETFIGHKLSRL